MNPTHGTIILNPHADKGKAKNKVGVIRSVFEAAHWDVDILFSEKIGHAGELAYKLSKAGEKIIIAAGGDGTANEVVDGIMHAVEESGFTAEERPSFGLIPIGRGNDFAYSAGLIRNNVEAACGTIIKGITRLIDVGKLETENFLSGRFFHNGVGIGFEPMVNFAASDLKHISGTMSYVIGLIKVIFNYPKPFHLEVETDEEKFEIDTQQFSIGNGRRMGSTFLMCPYALLNDGLFDIVYANRPLSLKAILKLAPKFLKGTQLGYEEFSQKRSSRISIKCSEKVLQIHADGEEITRAGEWIKAEVKHDALKMFWEDGLFCCFE